MFQERWSSSVKISFLFRMNQNEKEIKFVIPAYDTHASVSHTAAFRATFKQEKYTVLRIKSEYFKNKVVVSDLRRKTSQYFVKSAADDDGACFLEFVTYFLLLVALLRSILIFK